MARHASNEAIEFLKAMWGFDADFWNWVNAAFLAENSNPRLDKPDDRQEVPSQDVDPEEEGKSGFYTVKEGMQLVPMKLVEHFLAAKDT